MNRLQNASSPYLRQHAHQAIDWRPWGPEALEEARLQDKPILLSVGYSACHWCHQMSRHNFEDPEVAGFMNRHFINIKVDREERPDVDQFYMEACQAIARTSGWPLHAFLLPDGQPFYAGTYFPPEPEGRSLSWYQALQYALYNFRENREATARYAARITQTIRGHLGETKAHAPPEPADQTLHLALAGIQRRMDPIRGGFGGGVKYPDWPLLRFLFNYAPEHAFFTLDQILRSAVYDQIGGGIARYAVDPEWRVPHFEKMLYDNAQLIHLLAIAFQLSQKNHYRQAAVQTLDFLLREMKAPTGGFYAALDAESGGEEGAYYQWDPEEIRQRLGNQAENLCSWLGLTATGKQTPCRPSLEEPEPEIQSALNTLLELRALRPAPAADTKTPTAWNALLLSGLCQAWQAFGMETFRTEARSLAFNLRDQAQPHFLADHALLIAGWLDAYSLDFDHGWIRLAEKAIETVFRQFRDPEGTLFFQTSQAETGLPFRPKDQDDLEMPSGNSAMGHNLFRAGILLGKTDWLRHAKSMQASLTESMTSRPTAHGYWLATLAAGAGGWRELAALGPQAAEMTLEVLRDYHPDLFFLASTQPDPAFPLFLNREAGDRTTLYLCREYACQLPVFSAADLKNQLR